MKKIKKNVEMRDYIIAKNNKEGLKFYYVRKNSSREIYLFSTKYHRVSYEFFKGGKSLMQLYKFHRWNSPILTKIIDRIPGQVEYALSLEPQLPKKRMLDRKYNSKRYNWEYA